MLIAAPLHGFREDAIGILSIAVGNRRADEFVTGLETHVRQQAKTGATQAVRPWVIGAGAIAALALVLGGVALFVRR